MEGWEFMFIIGSSWRGGSDLTVISSLWRGGNGITWRDVLRENRKSIFRGGVGMILHGGMFFVKIKKSIFRGGVGMILHGGMFFVKIKNRFLVEGWE